MTAAALVEGLKSGDRAALARAISLVEDQQPGFEELLSAAQPLLGRARRIGVTGPPGAGKSTLILHLVEAYRARGRKVAVVAVDPTSPMSGGALLGDRVRMEGVALDSGVFIRSMATRGSSGGIAMATCEVADLMDAFGFERVIIETVGVGQAELDVAQGVDTTVVVLVPESGDSIQTLKAGLMEIADVFVVNKADRAGAERLRQDVEVALGLKRGQAYRHVGMHHHRGASGATLSGAPDPPQDAGRPAGEARPRAARRDTPPSLPDSAGGRGTPPLLHDSAGGRGNPPWLPDSAWEPPVLATVATRERGLGGVNALVEALDRHHDYLQRSGMLVARRRSSLAMRTRAVVDRAIGRWYGSRAQASLAQGLEEVVAGTANPYQVAARIVEQLEGGRAT